MQPSSRRLPCGAIPMSPKVGVWVNNRTIRDVEDLAHGDGQKGESAELGMFLEVIVGVSAHKGRTPFEAGEALEG